MSGPSFQVLLRHVADMGHLHFATFGKEKNLRVRFPTHRNVSMLRCSPFLFNDFTSKGWFKCCMLLFSISLHRILLMYMTWRSIYLGQRMHSHVYPQHAQHAWVAREKNDLSPPPHARDFVLWTLFFSIYFSWTWSPSLHFSRHTPKRVESTDVKRKQRRMWCDNKEECYV